MIKRIVISGAPSTGKTSLINELVQQNYFCYPEVSREIILEQLSTGGKSTPWQDLNNFSKLVIDKRLEHYNLASKELQFYDRSIIDSIAYLHKDKLPINERWEELAQKNTYYKKVFITPPWQDIYTNDNERRESFNEAKKIHTHLINTYTYYKYQIFEVPKSSIKDRISFILNTIE